MATTSFTKVNRPSVSKVKTPYCMPFRIVLEAGLALLQQLFFPLEVGDVQRGYHRMGNLTADVEVGGIENAVVSWPLSGKFQPVFANAPRCRQNIGPDVSWTNFLKFGSPQTCATELPTMSFLFLP